MRRPAKVKTVSPRSVMRKSTLTSSAAARRSFPAWIDASDRAAPFAAVSAMPRVRDGLILRTVAKRKSAKAKSPTDVSGAR